MRAEEVKAGDLVISQAWSRATPNGAKIGAGYLTIENKGTTADRLVGVSDDVSPKIEVHEMSMTTAQENAPVTADWPSTRQDHQVAPTGHHLMIMDLKSPLKQGDKVPVTLEFEKAGKVAVTLDVQGVGAQGPGGGDGRMKMSPGMKM